MLLPCLGALERPKASCVPGKEGVRHPRCSAPSQVLGCSLRQSPLTPKGVSPQRACCCGGAARWLSVEPEPQTGPGRVL